jgi:transposase
MLEGICWILRTGAPWRDLPAEFGPWQSVYYRLREWSKKGVWEQIWAVLKKESDNESHMIDATIVRAHQDSSRISEKDAHGFGRSRGGLTSKIHLVVDAIGLPIDFSVTGGDRHDITQAEELLRSKQSIHIIADKGYDSNDFRALIAASGRTAVIPARTCRKTAIYHDAALYKERHLVELCFCKLKGFRRIGTRYDKTKAMFSSLITIACILLWLK